MQSVLNARAFLTRRPVQNINKNNQRFSEIQGKKLLAEIYETVKSVQNLEFSVFYDGNIYISTRLGNYLIMI